MENQTGGQQEQAVVPAPWINNLIGQNLERILRQAFGPPASPHLMINWVCKTFLPA
jgi:hypothetical protein